MLGEAADKIMGRDTEILSLEALEKKEPEELPIDSEQPDTEDLETATFAMGCFWGPDAQFGALPGVIRTRVGYAGGDKESPTYHDLGNHAETVQIDFDPEETSYKELLEIFWSSHNCTAGRTGQYRSIIFYHDSGQRKKAQKTMDEQENPDNVTTEIKDLQKFNLAENYHQKYHLRQRQDFRKFFLERYSPGQLINSTAAARINGIIAGFGGKELEDEIEIYGLTENLERKIRKGL